MQGEKSEEGGNPYTFARMFFPFPIKFRRSGGGELRRKEKVEKARLHTGDFSDFVPTKTDLPANTTILIYHKKNCKLHNAEAQNSPKAKSCLCTKRAETYLRSTTDSRHILLSFANNNKITKTRVRNNTHQSDLAHSMGSMKPK